MINKEQYKQRMDEMRAFVAKLTANKRDPKQWARDILADKNYDCAYGIDQAKRALKSVNKGTKNES
jgi:hypothetical protein